MLNGWPCWNDSTLLLTRNVRVLQLLCAGGRDRTAEVEDYETSECSCIKESHVIEITQSACKITETKGSQMTWEV